MKRIGILFLILTILLTSMLTINVNVLAASTFPYNATYPYGQTSLASDQAAANSMLQTEWAEWKSQRITSSGAGGYQRVQRDASSNFDTVSESLGYGMLLAVYFDEQTLFNNLYRYVKKYFNSNGLMAWHIDANGNITTSDGGSGAATDADEDICLSLIFAHKKWGSSGAINYSSEASTYLNNLYNKCVESGTYVLKPGDSWGGSSVTNPSYFSPAWYRVFASFTGNNGWIQVANKCYTMAGNANNDSTGLVPDWCQANGSAASGQSYDYKYDATRYVWRTAIDYSWYGTAQGKTNCDLMSNFFKGVGAANVKDAYTLSGSVIGSNHGPAFVAPATAGMMTGTDRTTAQTFYTEAVAVKDGGNYTYYGNSLRMLCLLFATGNFPNLYNATTSTSTPTPTPTSTPTPTPSATPNGPTSTPTPTSATTPTPTPTPAAGGIKVQFFNGNTVATTNSIYPNFKVVNTSSSAISLADVKLRYYFTVDTAQSCNYYCDYSTAGSSNITSTFVTVAKTNADRYVEIGFTSSAGTLSAGASAEIKGRIAKADWSNFTQTNDYSFDSTDTNYVDYTKTTGYIAGTLKWGTEP